ncbi:hypothetical protein NI467_01000 [Acinetobacter bohemicus]|uniref:hypothetical protein n=1 Tax=Acinetobacter sp. S4397-1 TaxID=2972915 RepID=UPI00209B84FE|nr:hypothetical protein [Acinetobacter sp. S4397-1]MCO8043958.1 hypothetical protein [Acinetobacter sp. S4397-1]
MNKAYRKWLKVAGGYYPILHFTHLPPKNAKYCSTRVSAGIYQQSLDGENAVEMLQQKAAEPTAKQHQKLFQDTFRAFIKSAARSWGWQEWRESYLRFIGRPVRKK